VSVAELMEGEPDGYVEFEWDDLPRSVNAGGGGSRKHWGEAHKEKAGKRGWDGIFAMLAIRAKLPRRLDRVVVSVELQFSDPGTRRDPENFRHPVVKPLADALVKAGFIPDDTDNYFRIDTFTINRDVKLDPKKRPGQRAARAQRIVVRIAYRFSPGSHQP